MHSFRSRNEVIDGGHDNPKVERTAPVSIFSFLCLGFSFFDHSPISNSNETLFADSSDAALAFIGRVPNIRN